MSEWKAPAPDAKDPAGEREEAELYEDLSDSGRGRRHAVPDARGRLHRALADDRGDHRGCHHLGGLGRTSRTSKLSVTQITWGFAHKPYRRRAHIRIARKF